ncbi:hypothetical protein DCO58_07030 [Helicobacter saguini]|uniref:Uncharacterized protein n=1 Tax=Helicobacter saguini TaxID=1548018 RepID=A0A347VN39_9HELI|nr:hypothetical protein [Helicobacter saguini]MWV61913.1 hypothetical protein [Helicobacter saguini]MWV67412.1 hypothetical protein [Helicobacter saguini]MWV69765.1 hypothetical protein [Helicobacter saguini]MWV73018.1 hypothetical protein [Helicobacter saguini]TLD95604.1 hypothetical protein LS64_001755 [Helicobacter saguini]
MRHHRVLSGESYEAQEIRKNPKKDYFLRDTNAWVSAHVDVITGKVLYSYDGMTFKICSFDDFFYKMNAVHVE